MSSYLIGVSEKKGENFIKGKKKNENLKKEKNRKKNQLG